MSIPEKFPGVPDLAALPEFLPTVGFREMREATADDLPSGSLVVLFNKHTSEFEIVLVRMVENHHDTTKFYYTHRSASWKATGASAWGDAMFDIAYFQNYLYRVIG